MQKINSLINKSIKTPFYVADERYLLNRHQFFEGIDVDCFFPLKTQSEFCIINALVNCIDGYAVSSLNEAKYAHYLGLKAHFTSPGLRADEFEELISICAGISFNSLSQWNRFKDKAVGKITCGLRVNPALSYVEDERYNPSKKYSRLGIPINFLKEAFQKSPDEFSGVTGIHFHTNCDSEDWTPLLKTVQHLDREIPEILKQCEWINFGGGYLLEDSVDLTPLRNAVQLLKEKYNLKIIIEPGAAIVREACVLVASVIDLMTVDGQEIAVLDTTVNHMPEVFEYQFSPDVEGDLEDGKFSYILAGSTCLSGDVFGEYAFDKPLEINSKIVFTGMGAYTMVKAHMFNGINLPSVYMQTVSGELVLCKEYTYEDFRSRCGADINARLRNPVELRCDSTKQRVA